MFDASVKALQANLKSRGYAPGALDGDFMALSLHALLAFALSQTQSPALLVHAQALAPAMRNGGIIGRYRVAHFLGNILHETLRLTRLVESLSYSTPDRLDGVYSNVHGLQDAATLIKAGPVAIANRVYAGVNGNGNEASGDGWRYRGRGYPHHTGRDNYAELKLETGIDFLSKPELLQQPGRRPSPPSPSGMRACCRFRPIRTMRPRCALASTAAPRWTSINAALSPTASCRCGHERKENIFAGPPAHAFSGNRYLHRVVLQSWPHERQKSRPGAGTSRHRTRDPVRADDGG